MKLFATKQSEMYYNSDMIDKTNALYRLIIGQRSNGKTYCILKKCLTAYIKEGVSSAYLRRYSEEIRPKNISFLLDPHIDYIKKLTKNKYNSVVYRNGAFYLALYDDEKNEYIMKDTQPCLHLLALNTWNTTKGADRGFLKYIVFDEFMTRELYLHDEFVKFTNCLSSLIRDRTGTIIYMLANTVNRYSPYFDEMGLYHVQDMIQGTIELYNYNNDKLTVAVEYCSPSKNTKEISKYYAFDSPQLEMIKTGAWEVDSYRHVCDCGFDLSETTCRGRFYVQFNAEIVVGEIHTHGDQAIIFYHPFGNSNKKLTSHDVVYTDHNVISLYWSNSFNYTYGLEFHKLVNLLMNTNRDYYSNNSVGEIVNNFRKWGKMR